VRDARGKLRGLRLAGAERAAKQQSNLHASLLTAALLNIGHSDQNVRVVSMQLLESICADLKVEEAMDVATQGTLSVLDQPILLTVRNSDYTLQPIRLRDTSQRAARSSSPVPHLGLRHGSMYHPVQAAGSSTLPKYPIHQPMDRESATLQ
jgi:hypothetical protein